MPLSRRRVLRNAGAIGAAQTLAAAAGASLLGCKSTPAPQPVPVPAPAPVAAAAPLRILFEGPWIFSPAGKNMVRATAPLNDGMHLCIAGKWAGTPAAIQPIGGLASPLVMGKSWSAPLGTGTPLNSYDDKIGGAFTARKAIFVKNPANKIVPLPKDVSFILPVPDEVFLGGHFTTATVTDATSATLPIQPFAVTILRYDATAWTPKLTFTDPSTPGATFSVGAGDDLVLRLRFRACTSGLTDQQHVIEVFKAVQTRATPKPALSLTLTNTDVGLNESPDGISDNEMGIDPNTVHCVPAATGGIAAPALGDLANCAGGGQAFGGCGDSC